MVLKYTNGETEVEAIQYTGNNQDSVENFLRGRVRAILANNDVINMTVDGRPMHVVRHGFVVNNSGYIMTYTKDDFLSEYRRL